MQGHASGGHYPSDLSDLQWELIRGYIPAARRGGRPRSTKIRDVVNAVFYLNRSGCSWRYLPRGFPPWKTVYDYFRRWKKQGVWQRIHDTLRNLIRDQKGKDRAPATLIIDSQSVKAAHGQNRGYDGFKGIRGRKRHVLVDTLGLIHALRVHAANRNDTITGHLVFENPFPTHRLKRIYADHGYRGTFVENTATKFGFKPIIPRLRPTSGQGKRKLWWQKIKNRKLRKMAPKRWIVERTFAWFNHYRRLSKDYERITSHSEAMVYIAMTQLMLARLSREVT